MPKVSWYTDVNGVLTELVNGIDRITVVEERNYTGRYIRSLLYITYVQPSQDYTTYKCIAENIVGNSTHDIILTDTREPDPPTDISVIEVTWENITVTWTAGYDGGFPQYFVVGRRMSGTGDFDESQAIHESQYTLTELQPETAYDIYIKAKNNIDWSQPSETIVVVTSARPLSPLKPPSRQNSNTGIIAGLTTPLVLLMVAFVTVLLILLRKGVIRRKVVREDGVELDYVNESTQQEVDKRLQATYEEIPQSSSKGKSSAGGLQKKMDKENDTYMDLVPGNFSEKVYMKPDSNVAYSKESTYTDLSPNKGTDGIYMKIGQNAFEFPRDMVTIRNVLWSGKTHQIAVAKAWNIGGRKGITEVAVKKAKDGSNSDQEADILRESVLMKNIPSHPNVVQLLGVCTESAPTFILLEYLIQGNLWSTIEEVRSKFTTNKKDEVLTEKQLLSFTLDIAEGMKHLEELGIVHRYLSPKHILVDWSLHCKISNFGYASNVIDSASFMAKAEGSCPERWMAIESLVDLKFTSKSDVWAFGVVLWHTMTLGETPYASINLIHLAEKLMRAMNYQDRRYVGRSCVI
ncbi:ephrin receptor 1-like [Ptychodera flava]|uniref:ephrin receptor 1-like n=1 Tax=Ptychodera flava TaxID=63121 RepID=UPI00396A31DC